MALTNVDLYRIDGTVGSVSNISTSALNGGPLAGARNRIINGDMRIDQRNAGAAVTVTVNTYTVDRFFFYSDASSKFSFQQNAGAVTSPSGFTNYLGFTSLSAYSATASQAFLCGQSIEGFNIADLGWGSANAQPVTLSFWVRSSLTGKYAGALQNSAGNRAYVFTYNINNSATWEYKTITVPGDTSGTWLATNGIGIRLGFDLGSGSNFQGTASSWQAGDKFRTSDSVNLVGTNGATFYITGVQLEAGTVATPFERRSYGQELALCQRYCQVFGGSSAYNKLGTFGTCSTGATVVATVPFLVAMRSAPSASISGSWQISDGVNGININSFTLPANEVSIYSCTLSAACAATPTQFRPYRIESNNSSTALAIFSAEL